VPGLCLALYFNGPTKELSTPTSLAIAGLVLAATGWGSWILATNERAWIKAVRPTVDRESHLSGLRIGAYVLLPSALFCFFKGVYLLWGGG
jgi:hypothetical protein